MTLPDFNSCKKSLHETDFDGLIHFINLNELEFWLFPVKFPIVGGFFCLFDMIGNFKFTQTPSFVFIEIFSL